MANTFSELKDHENAIKYYTKAIELNPKMVQAYVGRAKDCGDMGDYKCSLDNYEVIKKMYPNDPDSYWATSLYKTNTKDLEGAMADIDKAISMVNKPNATYYAQKAWVYLEKEEYDNATEYLRKALKTDINDGYALGLFVFMAADNDDYDMVIKISRRLFKYNSCVKDNHALYAIYAKALYKKGKKKEALKQIEKAMVIEPYNTDYPKLKEKMSKGEVL